MARRDSTASRIGRGLSTFADMWQRSQELKTLMAEREADREARLAMEEGRISRDEARDVKAEARYAESLEREDARYERDKEEAREGRLRGAALQIPGATDPQLAALQGQLAQNAPPGTTDINIGGAGLMPPMAIALPPEGANVGPQRAAHAQIGEQRVENYTDEQMAAIESTSALLEAGQIDQAEAVRRIDAIEETGMLPGDDVSGARARIGTIGEAKAQEDADKETARRRQEVDLERAEVALEADKAPPAAPKATEAQLKAAGFASRMEPANEKLLALMEDASFMPSPGGGRFLYGVGTEFSQAFNVWAEEFSRAVLRLESGGAITEDEKDDLLGTIPERGDLRNTVLEKNEARKNIIQSKIIEAGPAYQGERVLGGDNALRDYTMDEIQQMREAAVRAAEANRGGR